MIEQAPAYRFYGVSPFTGRRLTHEEFEAHLIARAKARYVAGDWTIEAFEDRLTEILFDYGPPSFHGDPHA